MRIVLVSFAARTRATGVGRWSHRVAEALAELGERPTLWFDDDFPALRSAGRLAVLLFPIALAIRLVRARRELDVALVHEPSGFWYGVLRKIFPTLPPMLAISHGVESRVFASRLEASERGLAVVPLAMRVKAPLARFWQSDGALRLADGALCLSTLDARWVERRLHVPRRRITRFRSGVGPENFAERAGAHDGQRVVFVGGWIDTKGRRLLPRIWARVSDAFPRARLTLIGTGFGADVVLAEFDARARASITVIPRVDGERAMTEHYARHDIFFLPSLAEATPLALMEAWAAGLCVVASRVGGILDIATDDRDALLFDALDVDGAVDRLSRALGDPELASRLARAGQERARALTWRESARAVRDAARRALDGASR